MSDYRTHALVGAACGLALAAIADRMHASWCGATTLSMPCGLAGAGLSLGSAACALWPDLDEPQSWIARRWRSACVLIGVVVGGWIGWNLIGRIGVMLFIGSVAIGGLTGWVIGATSLALLRRIALGHRGLTHSLAIAALMMGGAMGMGAIGASWAALALGWAAWGVVTHVIADITTPEGVPLLAPFCKHRYRLPRIACIAHSETAIRIAALVSIVALLAWS